MKRPYLSIKSKKLKSKQISLVRAIIGVIKNGEWRKKGNRDMLSKSKKKKKKKKVKAIR